MTLFPFPPMFEHNYVSFDNGESTCALNKTVPIIKDQFKMKKKERKKRSSIQNFQLNKVHECMGLH